MTLAFTALLPTAALAQAAASGSWYNPAQSGHGLAIDQLTPSSALLLWFAYDGAGNPMPLYSEARRRGIEFEGTAFAPFGPRFGDWDPAELHFEAWGTLAFQPQSCEHGTLRWQSNTFGDGTTPLQLLAYTAGTACPHAARPASSLGGLSGTWYHSQLQGAGVNVQVIDDSAALAYWYTYDAGGQPLPLYLHGRFEGRTLQGEALSPRGMRFGSFRREELAVAPFGTAAIDFHDCGHATLHYDTPLGAGALPLVRLTRLDGVECALPAGMPADLPRHFEGRHFPGLETTSVPIAAIVTSRDEVLLAMDGKVRRGFFAPAVGATLQIVFDDGTAAGLSRESPHRLQGYVGPGVTGRRVDLSELTVLTHAVAQVLPGTWGNFQDSPISNAGEDLRVAADGSVAMRLGTDRAEGRIGNIDEARGTFDFDLRFRPFDDHQDSHRIIGSGRIVQRVGSPDGPPVWWIELFGSGPAGRSFHQAFPRVRP